MLIGPFKNQVVRPPGKASGINAKRFNVVESLEVAVQRMKVRRGRGR